jgi:hypothetical protein
LVPSVRKSHLLKNITTDKKNIAFDDTDNIKKSLAQILLYLFKEKKPFWRCSGRISPMKSTKKST